MEQEEVNKIYELKDEIEKVSDELIKKAQEIDSDVMTTRNNPEIKKIWNKLCKLHMKTIVACEYDAMDNKELAKVCGVLTQPQACITVLHLAEEETCCARFLKRIREEKQ